MFNPQTAGWSRLARIAAGGCATCVFQHGYFGDGLESMSFPAFERSGTTRCEVRTLADPPTPHHLGCKKYELDWRRFMPPLIPREAEIPHADLRLLSFDQ